MCMKSFQTAGMRQTALVAISPLTVSIPAHAQCLLTGNHGELPDGGHEVDGVGGHQPSNRVYSSAVRTRNANKLRFMRMYQ
jgi:hypothetical protein